MCFAVVCCKVGMNYVDGGVLLSGLFGLCGGGYLYYCNWQ